MKPQMTCPWACMVSLPGKESIGKESTCQAGDPGLIPGSGRSSGEGNDNSLQYICLGNPMDRGTWWATVHGVARVRHDLATKPPLPPMCLGCPTCFFWPHVLIQVDNRGSANIWKMFSTSKKERKINSRAKWMKKETLQGNKTVYVQH